MVVLKYRYRNAPALYGLPTERTPLVRMKSNMQSLIWILPVRHQALGVAEPRGMPGPAWGIGQRSSSTNQNKEVPHQSNIGKLIFDVSMLQYFELEESGFCSACPRPVIL
jgi:hypothetical protein